MSATLTLAPESHVVRSPLVDGASVETLWVRSGAQLTDAWRRSLQMDVADELESIEQIALHRCRSSGLEFFTPEDVAGSAAFYAQLQQREDYYQDNKWEFDAALADMRPGDRLLELGCGDGAFLDRAAHNGCDATGLEINADAVAAARSRGLQVEMTPLEQFARTHAGQYDVVAAFQVLEHVPTLRAVLDDMVALLKPGGRLLIAVPNQASFVLRVPGNVLDMPPHHLSRWRASTLRYLPEVLPLRVRRVVCEPLAPEHVIWWAQGIQHSVHWRLEDLTRPWLTSLLRAAVTLLPISRRWLYGHGLYGCFERR